MCSPQKLENHNGRNIHFIGNKPTDLFLTQLSSVRRLQVPGWGCALRYLAWDKDREILAFFGSSRSANSVSGPTLNMYSKVKYLMVSIIRHKVEVS